METKNWTCAEADGCWNVYEESAEPGDKLVAEVYGFDPEGRARRISAVPELVEALELLQKDMRELRGFALSGVRDSNKRSDWSERLTRSDDVARALIARIRGEE